MHVLDGVAVGLVVLASLAYAVFSLGPRTLRGRLLTAASAMLLRLPSFLPVQGLSRRLQAAAMRGQGSCGGCANCGSEPPAAGTAASGATATDIRVPLSSIGKR